VSVVNKIIEFKELGEITLRKSTRAKKISISVRPFERITITVPFFVSFMRAEKFIEEKENWLRKTMGRIRNAERSFTIFDYNTSFHTRDHSLEIIKIPGGKPLVKLQGRKILVLCPINRNIQDKDIQELIRLGIETAWRKEAKKYLPERLEELAKLHGFEFRKVTIKNNKSRWGSCSKMNNININLHLMRLPVHLSDYILLHELVHTIHKNHSKKFWKQLDTLTGNARSLDRELKQYRIEIY
jgi:predicted metal-dependent hydrolase